MKKLALPGFAVAACFAATLPANAADGCGFGFHRDFLGYCHPNRYYPPVVVVPRAVPYGVFYPGRGYWDGNRYWAHHYWRYGGWRYY
ncbi:hypothetical protein HGP17_28025 [Rhizobium sp. P38BS-XIX]|uniref:GCG_CRPN prefix-to-repeats domain-containing protein n=1 Tax=Rhizobium sp. P38BS-XIX TaxID=2726740 RepID=UPI0014567967|nr:hypothetical protein [Rhizobium sp. P38BS-XIX]NLS00695.1 hypothetical protein [Rhizobium sp. P38BS-XIX]